MTNTKNSRTKSKTAPAKSSGNSKKQTSAKKGNSRSKAVPVENKAAKQPERENGSRMSVVILVSAVIALILELSNINLLGQIGSYIQSAQFGLFGIMAYVFPIAGFLFVLYLNFRRKKSTKNIVCFIVLFFCLCVLTHLITGMPVERGTIALAYENSARQLTGGGICGGLIAVLLGSSLSRAGAYIIDILAIIVCVICISEYPVAEKISAFIAGRRERAYARYEEYADGDYYQYEYDDYAEDDAEEAYEEEPAPRRSRKKKEYDSREEVLNESEPAREHFLQFSNSARQSLRKPVFRNLQEEAAYASNPEHNRRAKVYEGTDDDGNYIKIVHVPSKKKSKPKERADMNRSKQRSQNMRKAANPAELKRSGKKTKGLGEGLEFYPLDANGDEVHEITDRAARSRRYAVEEAEAKMAAAEMQVADMHDSFEEAGAQAEIPFQPEEQRTPEKSAAKAMPLSSSGKTFSTPAPLKPDHEKTASRNTAKTSVAAVPVRKTKKTSDDDYKYPPLDILDQRKTKKAGGNDDLNKVSKNLELILSTYGVNAKVINAQEGPSVTRYELQPELGTRVSRITSLADDLKLNLAVPDIRIEAPIPGRAAVGIEIPNKTKETVCMRELLEEPTLISHPSKIAFAAGKDISGNVVVSDIAQMPHLLVAGTTGSGKSIFVNTILMTILYRAKPSEVGLIIIDPKQVEFGVYSGIPHLVQDVVTDPGQAVSTLRWAVVEMTNRYQRMQLSGVRDFKSYNAKFDKGQLNPEEENPKRMPQIVIVIDELADLMMVASKETESLICRLAQLARAAGIHLIIATQRPSVDVVTGLIKANIPARVALLVASGTDSRTIIDSNGAEKLLGKGDMLFYPTGYVKPVRVQGAFVSEREVYDTIQYIKEHNEAGYYAKETEEIDSYISSGANGGGGIPGLTPEDPSGSDNKFDEHFYEAGKLCIETGKASSSMIQRRFSIGFNRAARIIDQLEEVGAVGPQNGAKPREILVDEMQFEELWNSINA